MGEQREIMTEPEIRKRIAVLVNQVAAIDYEIALLHEKRGTKTDELWKLSRQLIEMTTPAAQRGDESEGG